jgi:hypothetical protein
MVISRLSVAVLALLSSVVIGCGGVPAEHVQAYSDAYERARAAGALMYEEITPAVVLASQDSIAPGSGPSYVATLGPAVYGGRTPCDSRSTVSAPASIQARCQALAAITSYNEVLLKLAAGDPAVAVRSDLAQISSSLGTLQSILGEGTLQSVAAPFIGPLSAAVGPLTSIVGEAQKLASASAVREELDKGRPLVEEMLEALRQDVPRLHAIQRNYYATRLTSLINEISENVYKPAGRLLASHAPPATPELATERAAIVMQFDALLGELEDFSGRPLGPVKGREDATPYTAQTNRELRGFLAELESDVGRYRELAGQFRAFEQALRRYDDMLSEVSNSLATLGSSDVDTIFGSGGSVAQWLSSAIAIRDAADDVRTILAAGSNSGSKSP